MPRTTNAGAGHRGAPRAAQARRRPGATTRNAVAAGNRVKNAGGEAHPHTEDNLDHGLMETFPASDPVSISPGAD